MSYNGEKKEFEPDTVTHCQSVHLEEATHICFSDQSDLLATPNHLFLCEDGKYRRVSSDEDPRDTVRKGTRLRTMRGVV